MDGELQIGASNAIYYTLGQRDGEYLIEVKFDNGADVSTSCGFVTANETHKPECVTILENAIA